jgi:hypothetical protein
MAEHPPFVWKSDFPCSVEELFAWHCRPGAFERMNPPWRPVRVLEASGGIRDGARIKLEVPWGPLRIPWLLEHKEYIQNARFCDSQISGPIRSWEHRHLFNDNAGKTSTLTDEIHFELPAPLAGMRGVALNALTRLFAFRHELLRHDIRRHSKWAGKSPLHIVIAGASGLIGQALTAYLTTAGHSVTTLVRRTPSAAHEHTWRPDKGELDPSVFEGKDAVIHLGGENVADGLWNDAKKKRMYESRVNSTALIANALRQVTRPPHTFLAASAIGYYGNTGSTEVEESAGPGQGFLANLCEHWERATTPALDTGVRVINFRIGVVLNPRGGVLAKLLPLFRFALGGKTGSGSQFVSWIALQDLLAAVEECLFNNNLTGPVNACVPSACTNSELTKALSRLLNRPALFSAPAFAIEAVFQEMAREVLLASIRARPAKLMDAGFEFSFANLDDALRFECGLLGK